MRTSLILTALLALGLALPAAAHERYERERSGYVWVPGYWSGHGHHRTWVEGRWQAPRGHYYTTRRDRDHDGIPNRYDHDRDGDGVPNRYDRRPDNPRRW